MNHYLMELEITSVCKAQREDMSHLPVLSIVYTSNLTCRNCWGWELRHQESSICSRPCCSKALVPTPLPPCFVAWIVSANEELSVGFSRGYNQ